MAKARKTRKSGKKTDAPRRLNERHHEAAETSRLNSAHWNRASDQSINCWLADELSTLRARAALEAKNNSFAEGVIETHVTDVVGVDGPTLQMQSSDRGFNRLIENAWRRWWRRPEISGLWTGPEILAYDIRSLWKFGDWFHQLTTDPARTAGEPSLRIRLIEPRRVASPATIERDVILGIRRDAIGRPIGYIVETLDSAFGLTLTTTEIPARDVIHGFWAAEADQVRGYPWLCSALPAIAELRDYDNQVLDAARAAADFAILLICKDPSAQPLTTFGDSVSIRRRQLTDMPPGYEAQGFTPPQPQIQYPDYRAERLRELGRPQGMPLLKVKLDASNANYSSARVDLQGYDQRVALVQGWMGRHDLDPLLDLIILEVARMRGLTLPEDADRHKWTWPRAPHVDELKEAQAASERIKNRTSCLRDECDGDWEELLAQQARERELMAALGLPMPETIGAAKGTQGADDTKGTTEEGKPTSEDEQ